jgi:hypothetical protein
MAWAVPVRDKTFGDMLLGNGGGFPAVTLSIGPLTVFGDSKILKWL